VPSNTPSSSPSIFPSTPQDKSFRLERVDFSNDFTGTGLAAASVTDLSDSTKSASPTITVFKPSGQDIAMTLLGTFMSVAVGSTVTVQFVSGEPIPSGQFNYAFQVNWEI